MGSAKDQVACILDVPTLRLFTQIDDRKGKKVRDSWL
jgi:hypothetical protein